jgi:alkylhydroperoxidase/carboxymuconolactone decarboxylase family protein YurZ
MIGWLINRQMTAFERDFDYDMSYARDILSAGLGAFRRFSASFGMARHRDNVARDAWYAAKIAAAFSEDCGPCTQLFVSMAERDGVNPATLRAILAADEKAMSPDAALGYRFARAVIARDISESDRLRTEVLQRWGQRGLVSLALTIASSRVFPALKYALGHGSACTKVRVGGALAPLLHHESHW